MTTHPAASSSAIRSISHDRWRLSVQCWAPSYSTATFHPRHPMSRGICRSRNSICVSGFGSPAPTNTNPALSPAATARRRLPIRCRPQTPNTARPLRESANATTSALRRPVAFISDSRIGTLALRRCPPISKAVRAGVVRRILATTQTSSGASSHECATIPGRLWRSARAISAGRSASSHLCHVPPRLIRPPRSNRWQARPPAPVSRQRVRHRCRYRHRDKRRETGGADRCA